MSVYDGGIRWAVVQRLYPEPEAIPMRSEAEARKYFKSWTEFAKTKAAPNDPDRWPQLVSAHITWEVQE
jgi:hypothetical protein